MDDDKLNELEVKISWLERCLEDRERLVLKARDMLYEKDRQLERLTMEVNNKTHTINRIAEAINQAKESPSEDIKEIENILTQPAYHFEHMH